VNDVSAGKVFGHDTTEVTLLSAAGDVTPVPAGTKSAVADAVWDAALKLLP